jgi:hypothetical protein
MRARRITLSSVACTAVPYFSTLSHKISERQNLLNIKCVLIFSKTFVGKISHSKKNLAVYCRRCT